MDLARSSNARRVVYQWTSLGSRKYNNLYFKLSRYLFFIHFESKNDTFDSLKKGWEWWEGEERRIAKYRPGVNNSRAAGGPSGIRWWYASSGPSAVSAYLHGGGLTTEAIR